MELICRKAALWRDLHFHLEKRLTRRDCRGTRCGCRCLHSSHLGDTPSIMRARSSCHSLRGRFSFISLSLHSALRFFCPPFCIFRAIFYRDNFSFWSNAPFKNVFFYLRERDAPLSWTIDIFRQFIIVAYLSNSMIFIFFYFDKNLYYYVYVTLKYPSYICNVLLAQ